MLEVLTLFVDIGLGALAYKMATAHRSRIEKLEARATKTDSRLDALEAKKCGQDG